MPKRLAFLSGTALIVTDLHGAWEPYVRLRDTFLQLHARGEVDMFVICGDLIHATGPDDPDDSLAMLRDVMRLQAELGPERVVMLLGNHEFPHIYSIPLAKGDMVFTPSFEKALATLGDERAAVIDFLAGLPYYAYTAGGVVISHGGASPEFRDTEMFGHLLMVDHKLLLAAVDERLAEFGYAEARAQYERIMNVSYLKEAREMLAVSGPSDPRYNDLLRGSLASSDNYEFDLVWSALFTRNEQDMGVPAYNEVVRRFLSIFSEVVDTEMRVLVAGHIVTRGGYALIGEQKLRLSSYAHARPNEAGLYLLLDTDKPVRIAADLISSLRPVFPDGYK